MSPGVEAQRLEADVGWFTPVRQWESLLDDLVLLF
jgi:hypothetical protein